MDPLQPQQRSDFPGVPLPAGPQALTDAADVGRRIALLSDTQTDVPGVTGGAIDPRWAGVGAPDAVAGDPLLVEGRADWFGGHYDSGGQALLWDAAAGQGWRGVTPEVWAFSVSGYSVLSKYLSYRIAHPLTTHRRQAVFHLCRRIAAIQALLPACDQAYAAALAAPLTVLVAPEGDAAATGHAEEAQQES